MIIDDTSDAITIVMLTILLGMLIPGYIRQGIQARRLRKIRQVTRSNQLRRHN